MAFGVPAFSKVRMYSSFIKSLVGSSICSASIPKRRRHWLTAELSLTDTASKRLNNSPQRSVCFGVYSHSFVPNEAA